MTRPGWPLGCPPPPVLWKARRTGMWWWFYDGESDGAPTYQEAYETACRKQLDKAWELDGYGGS